MYCIKLELVTTLTYCCLIQQYLSILSTWLHRYYLNWTRSHHTSTWFLITFLCWWHTALSLISTRRSNGICMDLRLLDLALHNIRKIRPFLTPHAAQLLVQALVISRLDYCNALLAGLPSNTIKPLQMIQNAAARLVFNEPKRAHVTPLFVSLHRLQVAARIQFKTLMLAYRTTTGSAPSYFHSLLRIYIPPEAPPTSTHYYESTSLQKPLLLPLTITNLHPLQKPRLLPLTITNLHPLQKPLLLPLTITNLHPSRSPSYFHSLLRIYIPSRSPSYFHSLLRIYIPPEAPPTSTHYYESTSLQTEPILPIRRIHKLLRAPETPGGPIALKDDFILVLFLNLARVM